MSLGQKIIRSSGIMASFGYLGIVVSFAGNWALARILIPDDFGVYALAGAILSLLFMLGGFGSQEAIVQNRDAPSAPFIATAFWISFGVAFALAVLGSVLAWVATRYYPAPIPAFILIMAWLYGLNGVAGTYGSLLQRDMKFRAVASYAFLGSVLSFAGAILAAWLGAGAWALLIREGLSIAFVVVGYIVSSSYTLPFTFDGASARYIWDFGWKAMVTRITEVIFGRLDNFMVGTFLGTAVLGHYSLAYRLNFLGQQFTQGAIQPVVFSAFAAMQHSVEQLAYSTERLLFWFSRFLVLLGVVVMLFGRDLVVVVYGENWRLAGVIFQQMWVFLAVLPLQSAVKIILMGTGHINRVVYANLAMLAVFVPGLVAATFLGGIVAVAWVANLSLLLSAALMLAYLSRVVRIRWGYALRSPVLAAVAGMAAVLLAKPRLSADLSLFVTVLALGALLVTVYGGGLLALEWRTLRDEFVVIWSRLANRA